MMSYEEAEAEALVTGDWTRVEGMDRRRQIEANKVALVAACDALGMIVYCETRAIVAECGCASRDAIFDSFGWRF